MAPDASVLYLSTSSKEIIEVDTERLVVKREIEIDYSNAGLIFYSSPENTIYGLTDSCIFSLDLNNEANPTCTEKFEGEFTFFTLKLSNWLLAYKSGLVKRIDENLQEFTIKFQSKVTKVKWSRSKQQILALVSTSLYILTVDLEIQKKFELRSSAFHAIMMENDQIIIVSTEDGHITIINTLSNEMITIPVHRSKIINFVVNPKCTKITTFGHDSKIGYLKVPGHKSFKTQNCYCSNYVFNDFNSEIMYIENSKSIILWNFSTDSKTLLYDASIVLTTALWFLNTKKTLVFCDTTKILFYNLTSRAIDFSISLDGKVYLTSIISDSNSTYLFTLASKNSFIYIYDINARTVIGIMKGHSARITCQVHVSRMKYLVTGGHDTSIIIWNYTELKIVNVLKGHTKSITCLTTTAQENKIISGSKDLTIKVWYCKTGQLLISINAHDTPISRIKVDKNNSLLSSSDDGIVAYWNLRTYAKIFSTKVSTQVNRIAISNDNQFLAYSNMDQLVVIEFHAFSDSFNVIGPDMNYKYDYMNYLMKILKGDKVDYDKTWDSWAVLPYQFNTLYFYAYANMYKHISSSILNKSSLIPSLYTDPYTMVIHKNYQRCLRTFFTQASNLLENNLYSLCFLSGEVMVKLNLQGHNQLHLFYESIFKKYDSEDFPKFAKSSELPKSILSTTLIPLTEHFFRIDKSGEKSEKSEKLMENLLLKVLSKKPRIESILHGELFMTRSEQNAEHLPDSQGSPIIEEEVLAVGDDEEEEEDQSEQEDLMNEIQINKLLVPIVLYISAIRMNYEDGSKNSINFLSSLLRCPNKEIFRTKFIQSLLLMKWNRSKKYQVLQSICYGVYLIVFISYMLFLYETVPGIILLLVVGCLIALYDVYQITLSFELFLRDMFNYFDALRLVCLIVYGTLYFVDTSYQSEVLTLLASVSFIRGLSFFRLFEETRYMVQLLVAVLVDVWSFGVLLAYFTMTFCFLFMIQGLARKHDDFSEYLKNLILLNLGEYNHEGYTSIEWMIFFMASGVNLIFMLNMLIAIMSETFSTVRANSEIANFIELTGMILEVEITIAKNSTRRDHFTYFQLCEEESIISKKKIFWLKMLNL